MNDERAESNIQVKVIDLSGLEKKAFDSLQIKEYNKELESVTCFGKWGYVETSKGLYLISNEGIGDSKPISDANPAEFEFSKNWNRDGERSSEFLPCIGYRLNEAEVRELPVKEVVTLDKFIRTFGSRLEVNYSLWQNHLNREMKNLPSVVEEV